MSTLTAPVPPRTGPAGVVGPLPPLLDGPSAGPVPLRPLSIGEVLDGAMDIVRRHPGSVLGVSTAVIGIQVLIGVPLWWAVSNTLLRSVNGSNTPGVDVLLLLLTITAASAVITLVSTIGAVLTDAATAIAVSLEAAGEAAPLSVVWARMRVRLGRLLLLGLALTGINTVIASIPIVGYLVPLFGGMIRLSVLAVVFEDARVGAALKRGWQISGNGTAGGFFRQLWVRFLAGVVGWLVWLMVFVPLSTIILTLAGQFIGADGPSGLVLLLFVSCFTLAYYLPLIPVWAFRSGVDTLLYVDGRMRGEALDVEWGLAARRSKSVRVGR